MQALTHDLQAGMDHPVGVTISPASAPRNRLTVAFRPILAIPHLLLVGGPIALIIGWTWQTEPTATHEWSAGGGLLGAVAAVAAMFSWFAIVFTGTQPAGLRDLATFYLRWRVHSTAYVTLLRDEYPPFGDGPYPANLVIDPPDGRRDRFSVGFRLFLILPHLLLLCVLGIAWIFTTIVAWFAILFGGTYPASLERFSIAVLRWNIRVEAYALLLHDVYPPFRLDS